MEGSEKLNIEFLKINGFGKIKNKEIKLEKNKINLIYGKNESGKSTILKFILTIFYGISKNKKNKLISDLEKYNPWNNEEFSGKLIYELDNNKKYEIFRDFKKKKIQIYNNEGKDITNEFNINKNKGNEFFYDQTKIDEDLFLSTTLVPQQEIVLDSQDQNILIQKIANILSSGQDNVSYLNAIKKLDKKLSEEIGTNRTIGKPKNIIEEKINNINLKQEELNEYILRKEDILKEKELINNKLNEKEIKYNLIKKIKKISEEINIENNNLNYIKKINNEKIEKLKIIKNNNKNNIEINNNNNENNSNNPNNGNNGYNGNNKKIIINKLNSAILIILIILNIISSIFNFNKYINYLIIFTTLFYLIYILFNYLKNKKNNNKLEKINQENNKIEEDKNNLEKIKINNIIELLEKEIEKEKIEINNKLEKINQIKNKYKKEIEDEYKNKIEDNEINEVLNIFEEDNYNKINNKLELLEKEINNEKLNLNSINIEEKNILNKLEEKASLEEELEYLYQEQQDILNKEKTINLAKETLEVAYNKMKSEFTPKFIEELSNLASKISSGKYKNVKFNDKEGLIVETETGKYINALFLSIGTIDQLYLSLRISAMTEIAKENMPIILDESFAYYDKERLENILKYLNENYKQNQIIIFSCSQREQEILDNLKLQYNFIEI